MQKNNSHLMDMKIMDMEQSRRNRGNWNNARWMELISIIIIYGLKMTDQF